MFQQIKKESPLYIPSIDDMIVSTHKDGWERWNVFFIHKEKKSMLNMFPVFDLSFLLFEKSAGKMLVRVSMHKEAKVTKANEALLYMYCDLMVRKLLTHARSNLYTSIGLTTDLEMLLHSLLDHRFLIKRSEQAYRASLSLKH